MSVLLLRSGRCERNVLGTGKFAALRAKFPLQRTRGRTSDFFIRMQIGASRRLDVCSAAILVSRGLCDCATLDSIFLYGDEVFGILTRVLRRANRAAIQRFKRLLRRLRGDLFFQFFLFRYCKGVFSFRDLVRFLEECSNDFFRINVILGSDRHFYGHEDFKKQEDGLLQLFYGESSFLFGCWINGDLAHVGLSIALYPLRHGGRRDRRSCVASGRPDQLLALRIYLE